LEGYDESAWSGVQCEKRMGWMLRDLEWTKLAVHPALEVSSLLEPLVEGEGGVFVCYEDGITLQPCGAPDHRE
jgi:hypothetical protein